MSDRKNELQRRLDAIADDVHSIVHAFPDEGRRNAVRTLAMRIRTATSDLAPQARLIDPLDLDALTWALSEIGEYEVDSPEGKTVVCRLCNGWALVGEAVFHHSRCGVRIAILLRRSEREGSLNASAPPTGLGGSYEEQDEPTGPHAAPGRPRGPTGC